MRDHVLHVARRQQVGLLDEVEHLVLAPGVILEAPVGGGRVDHRLGLDAHHPPGGVLPQRHVVLPEADLRLHQMGGIGHQPRRHLQERAADVQRIWRLLGARLALQPFGDDALRTLGDVGHGAAERGGVGQPEAGAVGRGCLPFGHRGVLSVGLSASYTGRVSVELIRPMRLSGSGAQPSGACSGVQAGVPGARGGTAGVAGAGAPALRDAPTLRDAISGCRRTALLTVLMTAPLTLGGCSSQAWSSINPVNWWHDLEGGKIAEQRPPPPGADQPDPNLASVPPKPAEPDRAALQNIADALIADRTNAQHMAAAAPLVDPSSPSAAPGLFGVGSTPPPGPAPPNPPPNQPPGASATLPAASAAPPPPAAPAAPPEKAPVGAVEAAPLAAPAAPTAEAPTNGGPAPASPAGPPASPSGATPAPPPAPAASAAPAAPAGPAPAAGAMPTPSPAPVASAAPAAPRAPSVRP